MSTTRDPATDPANSHEPAEAQPFLSQDALEHCLRVLTTLVESPNQIARVPEALLRELRIMAGRLSRPTRHERERVTKAIRRYERRVAQEADLELSQTTAIREGRLPAEEREAQARAALLGLRSEAPSESTSEEDRELKNPRNCYICKRDFTRLHFFYDCMCPSCAEFNYAKRSQTANLEGRVALVTGGRIKIGYHASLMMLRAGAKVIVTTRFPHDSAARYAKESDFADWKDRLVLYGLDLRHIPSVERFAEHLNQTLPRLDFLLNNAAQTVQRPPGFFAHLMPLENCPIEQLPAPQQSLLEEHHALFSYACLDSGAIAPRLLSHGSTHLALDPVLSRAPETLALYRDPVSFPPGRYDADGQQLDLRENNSWRMKAADVSTPELIEVHLVNAIAPFILCSRLKALMAQTDATHKHIVNVSAMEGVFARYTKSDRHPHTNMAKASLNMLTRTSAKDYLQDGIHMNSVDTGWVTDEDPYRHAVRKRETYDFHPPLDAIDGAARVCDPIFAGMQQGTSASGLLFKDYAPIEW